MQVAPTELVSWLCNRSFVLIRVICVYPRLILLCGLSELCV